MTYRITNGEVETNDVSNYQWGDKWSKKSETCFEGVINGPRRQRGRLTGQNWGICPMRLRASIRKP